MRVSTPPGEGCVGRDGGGECECVGVCGCVCGCVSVRGCVCVGV